MSDTGSVRPLFVLPLTLLLACLCSAQEHGHLKFFMKGKQIGENDYERTAEGAFKSSTTITLEPGRQGTLTGHFKDGKLVDSVSQSSSPEGSRRVVVSEGHVLISSGGQSASLDWKDENGAIFPTLHPQLFASGLLSAEKAIASQKGTDSTVLSVFNPEDGTSTAQKVTRLPSKIVKLKGKEVSAKFFEVRVDRMAMIFVLSPQGHVIGLKDFNGSVTAVADDWEGLFDTPKPANR